MNYNVNKDIEEASKLIKYNPFYYPKFSKYSSIYPFTNENISSYFNLLNINNKDVLTVAGSGDHFLELLMRDCKQIQIFDINILTKYYINLKIAGVRTLNYDEFVKFFVIDNNIYDVFNIRSYSKIRNNLDEESLIFWDTLYTKFSGNRIRKSKLFFNFEESYNFLKTFISYLNPSNYQILQHKLNSYEHLNIQQVFNNYDLTELYNSYSCKFDIILLSNIADFIDEIYKRKPINKFKDYIINDLSKLLNNNGIICTAYMFWADSSKQKNIPFINKKAIREKFFSDEFEELLIDNSAIKNCTNDHLLIYKKN